MTGWQEKLALTAQQNRQEIVKAKLSRREMMRLGLITAGGALVAKAGLSSRAGLAKDLGVPPSPPATPWAQPMPVRLHGHPPLRRRPSRCPPSELAQLPPYLDRITRMPLVEQQDRGGAQQQREHRQGRPGTGP